jgi:hypothetical protein
MHAWESRKTILVVTFSYCYTLTPNRPETESPYFPADQILTSNTALDFCIGHLETVSTGMHFCMMVSNLPLPPGMSISSPHPTHGLGKTCKHRRNKLPAPHTSTSSRLGNHAMHIFFWVYTVVMRPHSKTRIRKDPTVCILPIVVYIGAMRNNYPGVNIRP